MSFNSAPGSNLGNGPAKTTPDVTPEEKLERAKKSAKARIEIAMKQIDTFNKKPLEGFYVNHNPKEGQKDGWFDQSPGTKWGEGVVTTLTPDIESGKVEFIPFGDPRLEEFLTKIFLKTETK